MQIKITSWDNCPINSYYRIAECVQSERPDYEKQVELLSIVCDCDEEDIWNLPVSEVSAMAEKLNWIGRFEFDRDRRYKKINIGNMKCNVIPNLYNFTVAQYVDFQTYWKEKNHKLAEMLSVFIIPEGKTYNQGYDLLEFQKLIGDTVPLTTAESICFFFLKSLAISIKASEIYLGYLIKKMEKETTPETREKMETARKKMEGMMQDLYGCLL